MQIKKSLVSADVIRESGVEFGTSGARGLVTQFTPNVCAAFSHAFVVEMLCHFEFESIALAIDNRPSSYQMAMACAAALKEHDIEVCFYGVVPTPALAYVAQLDRTPAIMVTGSHIPFDRNGLKFYRPDGEITKEDEQLIVNGQVAFNAVTDCPNLIADPKASQVYIDRYTSLFESPWLTGKRIGIYEHSSAGRELYSVIFETLGAEVISLGRSDEFVPIDTEAVSEADKQKALIWSKEFQLDAIFSTDGDGDRPLVADENGKWLRGDILGLLSAEALNIQAIAVPVSCNTAIEISKKFSYVERTRIGSPYVIAAFDSLIKDHSSIAGFEANGGFLLGSNVSLDGHLLQALPTRDAVLPIIMLLLAAKQHCISTIVNELPQRFTHSDRIQNFATEKSKAILEQGSQAPLGLLEKLGFKNTKIENVDFTDGLRITLEDSRIIHLRPSGNAPELRCYAEANRLEQAIDCVEQCLRRVTQL